MEGTWGLRPGSMLTDPLAPDGFGGPELDLDLRQRSNLLELDRRSREAATGFAKALG